MRCIRRLGLTLTMTVVGLTPALLVGGFAHAADGTTYYVTTTGTDTSCTAGQSSATPLRTIGFALTCATNDSTAPTSPDTVQIAGGTYDEYNLTVTANVVLTGTPAATIDGQGNPGLNNPILTVNSGNSVALNNLTLTGAGWGGALIDLGGTVTVENGAITNNVGTQLPAAESSAGDAITNVGGTVTLKNTTVSDNVSTGDGGAILDASGKMIIAHSTITGNAVDCANGCGGQNGGAGGGIWNGGALTITDSKITNNKVTCDTASCFANGGGILNGQYQSSIGTVRLKNSQVEGNTASCTGTSCTVTGGGISNAIGTVKLRESQVENNSAACSGSACSALGGGIYNATSVTPVGKVMLVKSQVSKNTPNNCTPIGKKHIGSIAGCTN